MFTLNLPRALSLSLSDTSKISSLSPISVSKPRRNNQLTKYSHLFSAIYVPFNHLTKPPTSPTPSTKSCTALDSVGCSTSSTISPLSKSCSRSSGGEPLAQSDERKEVGLRRRVKKVTTNPAIPANLLTSNRAVTNLFKNSCFYNWLQKHRSEVLRLCAKSREAVSSLVEHLTLH
nr:uncharacterized protein LOC112013633 [Quercus suber]